MPAPSNVFAFDLEQAAAAADRWAGRTDHHKRFEAAVRKKQYTQLDTAERCAARTNRLLGQLQEVAPEAVLEVAGGLGGEESFAVDAAVTAESVTDALLERVIGKTRDFQFVEFLDAALFACRSVGRIVTRLGNGRKGFGTGFMVSPSLLITNHHVLPTRDSAAASRVEFDFQRDRLGRGLAPRAFDLDPATFFLNDQDFDFALVAVSPAGGGKPLSAFGWCPLLPSAGKIVTGEPINIIQHPLGEMKQVVIRENRLLDSLDGADRFYHYEADTEPGSSGSPVFNDQWEVVALHHSGVPKRNARGDMLDTDGRVWKEGHDPKRLDWVANEGVRISKLVEFISKSRQTGEAARLLSQFLKAESPPEIGAVSDPPAPRPVVKPRPEPPVPPVPPVPPQPQEAHPVTTPTTTGQTVHLVVPLHITISLGAPAPVAPTHAGKPAESLLEKIEIDPDYDHRPGYDPNFLGFKVPFPKLTSFTRPKAYALAGVSGEARFELKYHHYSVLFNQERKLAFVAGVNYDPTAAVQFSREGKDEWSFDPRVTPKGLQAGNDLYADNPLDRGHLVRRADAAWGDTEAEAKLANDDTFHFTNCSPQHAITNQGKGKIKDRGKDVFAPPGLLLWGKLETHVAAQGKEGRRKLCIFNGPVFRSTDEVYRGVQIPKEFWKLVVFADDAGKPSAVAFVLSQAELIQDLKEEFEVGEYEAVQVRVADLAARTKLDFGPFTQWDTLEQEGVHESFAGDSAAVVLKGLEDVLL